jgi:hypothetical protein
MNSRPTQHAFALPTFILVVFFIAVSSCVTLLAQTQPPEEYPVTGGVVSLPLHLLSALMPGDPSTRPVFLTTTPCSAGGTAGNFTIVLNCDGNDSNGSASYSVVPDTDLAVGDQYFFQTVDNVFTIYNKTDASVVEGPDPLTLPWTGFKNGSCSTPGSGDDFFVRYDKAAARWILGLPIFGDAHGKYWLCLAVSTSSDPTGTYYLYSIEETGPSNPIWDYPKLGIWTDAYYVGFNMISPKPVYIGPRACALDRTSMLLGLTPAHMQCFSESGNNDSFMLPADIAGGSLPVTGEPEFFLDIPRGSDGVHNALNLWKFHVDFTNSQNSTFIQTPLPTADYTEAPQVVGEPHGWLYTRSDRLMVPLVWRQTSDSVEHLIVNDAVLSSGITTEQWFDITNPNTTPVVAQQSTLMPGTNQNFWMGSANIDKDGNIALGFSVASHRFFPGIFFTGRLSTDPVNTMEAGQNVISGGGYQNGVGNEWGDHSIMAVDPADDCTFWYSTEYYTAANTDSDLWSTRVIEFKFTSCQ